ncbi:hypothetical protein [Nocardiopsis synnemataformans]|uniref:hypothetical protein n=1 Tax=Nocardiopsis synnemataformans TaxID=61305 RepID=UPI003EBCBBF8
MSAAILVLGILLGLLAYGTVGLLWAAPRRVDVRLRRRGDFYRSWEDIVTLRKTVAREEIPGAVIGWPADLFEIIADALGEVMSRAVERRTPIRESEARARQLIREKQLKRLQQDTDRLRAEQEGADGQDR